MALITDISITIDSTVFDARVRHLNISQSINNHHQFSVEFELASIEGMLDHFILDKSKDYVGSVIQISIKPIDFLKQYPELNFKGVITNLSATRANRRNGDTLIISGYSPDILTNETPNCRSFEKVDIKQIFSEVLQPYPSNLLALKSSPKSSTKFEYIVQYNETNFDFLTRLAVLNGEWFFYDGLNLNLGLSTGSEVDLEYGSDLTDFNFSLGVSPLKFSFAAYNYNDVKTYISSSSSAKLSNLNDNQDVSQKNSDKLYTSENTKFHVHHDNAINQSTLDKIVKKAKHDSLGKNIICNGQSENPGVQIGQIISISGKNLDMEKDPNYGKYLIISVNHTCDLEGNYMNTFSAIPSNISDNTFSVSPVIPRIEAQSAVVTDVNDPDKLGRIRVRFYWQDTKSQSPWIRIVNPYAGNSRGAFIIPEVNDEVLVQFEGSNAEKPYVVGSLYNGNAKPDAAWPHKDNNTKAFRTRSGHSVILSDEKGKESITIYDKENTNSIEFDTAKKKLTIYSKGDVNIQGENIELSAKKNITLKADGEISEKAMKDISLEATGNINQKATKAINQKATTDLKAEGMNVTVKGTIATKISGTQAELSGSAMTTVKGALVKIN